MEAVSTGQEAIDAMTKQKFDCVVLDLRLPDMSGFDLLKKIQSDAHLRDVPVVVFTGKELTSEEETLVDLLEQNLIGEFT